MYLMYRPKGDIRGALGQYPGFAFSPRQAWELHELISRFPPDTNFSGPQSHVTRKSLLEGLFIEWAQPISLDALMMGPFNGLNSSDASPSLLTQPREELIDVQQADLLDTVERNIVVHQLLRELADRDYRLFEVVMFRYGFWDGYCWTLDAIAEQLGVTRERVRQLHDKAITELQNIALARAVAFEVRAHGPSRPQRWFWEGFRLPPRHRHGWSGVLPIPRPSEVDLHTWTTSHQIAGILGVTPTTLYHWRQDPTFPPGRQLTSEHRMAYSVQAVLDWAIKHRNVKVIDRKESS